VFNNELEERIEKLERDINDDGRHYWIDTGEERCLNPGLKVQIKELSSKINGLDCTYELMRIKSLLNEVIDYVYKENK